MVSKNETYEDSKDFDDGLILEIAASVKKYKSDVDNGISVIRADSAKDFNDAYNGLKRSVSGKKISIKKDLSNLKYGMVSIEIVGKEIFIKDPDVFFNAVVLSGSFDLYAKTDGSIVMSIAFYDMTEVTL